MTNKLTPNLEDQLTTLVEQLDGKLSILSCCNSVGSTWNKIVIEYNFGDHND